MPPNTQVIIFDDSTEYVETVIEILESEGHTIIGSAGSIAALEKNLPDWKLKIVDGQSIVAILDNRAPWNDGEFPDQKGVGKVAERTIKQAIENTTTIATTSTDSDNVGYGDHRYNRIREQINIGVYITNLPAVARK